MLKFLILLTFCLFSFIQNSDICPYVDNSDNNVNAWQEILDKISHAEAEYVPCAVDDKCSDCFDKVIENDLKPFQDGINQDMIKKAESISRVTKYQIISGQLYRSEDCMFPFRCTGIEHFLTHLIEEDDDIPDTEIVINTRDWPQLHSSSQVSAPVFSFSKTSQYLVSKCSR